MAAEASWLFPGRIARLRIPQVGNFVLSTPVYLPRGGKVTTTTAARKHFKALCLLYYAMTMTTTAPKTTRSSLRIIILIRSCFLVTQIKKIKWWWWRCWCCHQRWTQRRGHFFNPLCLSVFVLSISLTKARSLYACIFSFSFFGGVVVHEREMLMIYPKLAEESKFFVKRLEPRKKIFLQFSSAS
jgi:hypothetical protein